MIKEDLYDNQGVYGVGLPVRKKIRDDFGNEPFYLIFHYVGDNITKLTKTAALEKAIDMAEVNPGEIFIVMKAEQIVCGTAVKVSKRNLGQTKGEKP
jgi:hypothetical protein